VRERAASIAELTGGTKPPPCDAAEFETALDTFVNAVKDPKAQALVRIDAGSYRKACNDAHRVVVGDIGRAAFAADAGGAVTKARAEEAAKLNERLKQAADEYAAAVKVVKAADTNQTRKHLQDATAKLKGALNSAAKGLSTLDLEVLPEARVQAIDYILSAVASGQVNAEKVTDPDFARAAAVAGDVPSLAGTIAIMVRKASSPSVSDLLIEKEHQLLLREYALRRTAFAEHRAALHEARYRALVLEGDLVVANHDALCNFMEKQAGIGKRVDCDTLRVTLEQPVDAPVAQLVACEFALGRTASGNRTDQTLAGADCPLAMSWRVALDRAKPEAKRHLYEAISTLARRRAIAEVQQDEVDMMLVNLAHQEVLTADEYAVRAWNSLIATPVNQLAAYHQTGIKPAELADLIVKAVGLGAIGIGVNR
jgi:prefoldin subunit 5